MADGGQQYMALDTAGAGSVTITSDLDGTAVSAEVHDAGDIDGIEQPVAWVLEDIDAGDTNAFHVRPMVGNLVVCQGDTTKTVQSLTPDICDVRNTEPASADAQELGWFEIEGIAAGTCQYSVTFTAGAAGAGVTQTFEYEIQP